MPKAHAPWVLARRPAIDTLDNTMAHTRSRTFPGRSTAIAGAALLVATGACAQVTTLEQVTVTGRSTPAPTVGGWGDVPLSQLPLSASVTTAEQMRDRAITRLADVVRLDPAASDAYNAVGYWDYLTLRGFVIDNRFNYRRDGLPISAETSIALDNKERIELLKGASGLQAGTSAPGGLVNFVVKRPLQAPLRSVQLGLTQRGSVSAAADINQRFGAGDAFGLRLNAAAEHLDAAVNGRAAPAAEEFGEAASLPVMGAFVSAKRAGKLRSCCGFIGQAVTLAHAVAHAAARTAGDDHRFPPISRSELPYLDLEVWLLNNPQLVAAKGEARIAAVEIGKHGLIIERGTHRGLLLPGVATEHNFDAETFLQHTCLKAELPPTAWREDACPRHLNSP